MVNTLEIHQFICRSDNFGLLMHDKETGLTASIDTPDGETIWRELKRQKLAIEPHFQYPPPL